MGVAWIQILDLVGSFLGFATLFAVLLMLGKISSTRTPSHRQGQRSL